MIQTVETLLAAFDALPLEQQEFAFLQILKRVKERASDPFSDETLCEIADETFRCIELE